MKSENNLEELDMSFSDFKIVKLKDITIGGKGSYGIGAPAVDYKESLYTYLRITDITDEGTIIKEGLKSVDDNDASNYLLEKNDIVFARTGNSTGRAYFYDERDGEFVYAGFLIKFKLDENKVNPKYIKLYTLTNEYKSWVKSFATGSTRNNINAKMYGDMVIKLPRRNIQDKIVDIIESLNEKIRINNQMNETLEEMAQVLFKRWFVDFEFPNEEGKPYKSSGGEMVESELGMMPKGWNVKLVSEIVDVKDGTHASPKAVNEGYPLITSKHINGDRLRIEEAKLISETDYVEVNKRSKVDTGDILISMIGTVGLLYYVQDLDVNFAIKNLGLFKTSKIVEMQEYIYLYLKQTSMKNYIECRLAGTTQKYISLTELRKIPVLLPVCDLLHVFKEKIEPLLQMKQENINKNQSLVNIRDTLLPKLMSGEIRVSDLC